MKSATSALEVSTATVSHRRQRLISSKPAESTSTFYQAINSAKANTASQRTLKMNQGIKRSVQVSGQLNVDSSVEFIRMLENQVGIYTDYQPQIKRQQSVAEVELKKRVAQVFGPSSFTRPKTGREVNSIEEPPRKNEASQFSLYNDSVIIEEPYANKRSAFPMMTQSDNEEETFQVRLDMGKEYQKHKRALCMLKSLKDIGFEWDIAFCKYL